VQNIYFRQETEVLSISEVEVLLQKRTVKPKGVMWFT